MEVVAKDCIRHVGGGGSRGVGGGGGGKLVYFMNIESMYMYGVFVGPELSKQQEIQS